MLLDMASRKLVTNLLFLKWCNEILSPNPMEGKIMVKLRNPEIESSIKI
jgi:hypothetical protein